MEEHRPIQSTSIQHQTVKHQLLNPTFTSIGVLDRRLLQAQKGGRLSLRGRYAQLLQEAEIAPEDMGSIGQSCGYHMLRYLLFTQLMLRRCRLCARQLQSSRSFTLSARHRPKSGGREDEHDNPRYEQDNQPIASTSKHVFEPAWTSTLPRCLQRRRHQSTSATATLSAVQESENRFEHDFRRASSSNKSLSEENTRSRASGTSSWKGKARAVEEDSPRSAPWQASQTEHLPIANLQADSSASAHQPIISNPTEPSVAAIPDNQVSLDHFESLIKQDDYIACFLAVVQECLYSSQTASPHAMEDIRHRIRRMHEVFSNRPRTATLSLLTTESIGMSDDTFSFETLVPLLFKAVLEQDVYRQWRVRLQQLLRRLIPFMLPQSFQRADACLAAIMAEFTMRRRWESVEQVGRLARTYLGRWTLSTLPPFLEAIDRLDRHYLAPEIDSLPPDILPFTLESRIYDYLLKCHLSNRNLSAAKAVLESMTASGITPNRNTFEFVYAGYRPLGGYSTFLDDAKQLNLAPTTKLVNQVLDALIKEEGLAAGIEAIEALPRKAEEQVQLALGSPINLDHRRDSPSLLHADESTSTTSSTTMATSSPARDRSTFGLMIRAYATVGDFDKALDTYIEMVEEGYEPNAFTQAALVAAYRPRQAASHTNLKLRHDRKLPSPDSLPAEQQSKVLRAHLPSILRSEGLQGAITNLTKMNSDGIRLDDRSISIIFNYLAKSVLVNSSTLSRILIDMRLAHGSSYRVADVNTLMQQLIATESESQSSARWRPLELQFSANPAIHEDAALHFHDILEELSMQGSRPDHYTMMLIMKRFADNGGSPRRLWEFFRDRFLDEGFRPNAHHIGALMLAFVNAGDVFGARRVMDRGAALGVKPTIEHLTILLSYFVKTKQYTAAREILREIEERHLQPDMYVMTARATLEARSGDISAVLKVENNARSRFSGEVWPNLAFETIKLRCLLQLRKPAEALRALKPILQSERIVPDRHLYRTILSADRSARNGFNQAKEGTSAYEQARVLVELARDVKHLATELTVESRVSDPADLDEQVAQLLALLNENREIAGDFDAQQYEVGQGSSDSTESKQTVKQHAV